MIGPILQMRKLSLREAKLPTQVTEQWEIKSLEFRSVSLKASALSNTPATQKAKKSGQTG